MRCVAKEEGVKKVKQKHDNIYMWAKRTSRLIHKHVALWHLMANALA